MCYVIPNATRVHYMDTPPQKLIPAKINLLDFQQRTTNIIVSARNFLRLR